MKPTLGAYTTYPGGEPPSAMPTAEFTLRVQLRRQLVSTAMATLPPSAPVEDVIAYAAALESYIYGE